MEIHSPTLQLIPILAGPMHLLLMGLLYMVARGNVSGPGFWFAGGASMFLGYALRSLGSDWPPVFSIWPGNFFLILGLMLECRGYYALFGRPFSVRVYAVLLALHTGWNGYYLFVEPHTGERIVAYSLLSGLIALDAVRQFRFHQIGNRFVFWFMVLPALLFMLSAFVRGVAAFLGNVADKPPEGAAELIFFVSIMIFNPWLVMSQGLLVADRFRYTLAQRVDELADLIGQRDRFYGILAHELHGPLRGVTTVLEALQKNDYILPGNPRDILSLIHQSTQATQDLLKKLLLWIESGRGSPVFRPRELPPEDILNETIDLYRPALREKHLSIERELRTEHSGADLMAVADPQVLGFLLRNALHNAIRFSPPGGTVSIAIAETQTCQVEISVRDQGRGISAPEVAAILTGAEYRPPSAQSDRESGTGLGLRLCRELVLRSGGDFQLESQPGVGTSVTYRIPAAGSNASAGA